MPCRSCQERGFKCGREDKVLGAERQRSQQELEFGRSDDSENTSPSGQASETINLSIELGQQFFENDSVYLQFLLTNIFPGGRNLMHGAHGRNMIVSAFRMDFAFVGASLSPSIRAALLVLGSYLKEGDDSDIPFTYYQAWCTAANRDIVDYKLEDLILSTYIMTIYASFKIKEREVLLVHARQFCRVLEAFSCSRGERFNYEWDWYETLWQPVITIVYHATRESHTDSTAFRDLLRIGQGQGAIGLSVKRGTVGDQFDDLKALADVGINLLAGTNQFSANKKTFRRLRSLIICLRIHYEHFLYQNYFQGGQAEEGGDATHHITEELRQIMEIARLCPGVEDIVSKAYEFGHDPLGLEDEIPNTSSESLQYISLIAPLVPAVIPIRTSLLYCSSELLKGLLDPSFDFDTEPKNNVFRSAMALCRVSSFILSRPTVTKGDGAALARSLFWANLVLRKSTHPVGTSPEYCDADVRS